MHLPEIQASSIAMKFGNIFCIAAKSKIDVMTERHIPPPGKQFQTMRIVLVDENKARAAIIEQGLAASDDAEVHILSDRDGMAKAITEIDPDVILMDLGNPSRDILEEYFNVSRALSRPIAMFVDQTDEDATGAAIDAGVSAYIVDGLTPRRLRPVLDLAIRRFNAFARLQDELEEAKTALSEKEAVGTAKRILMQQRSLSENEAYKLLRSQAMNSNRKIAEVAEAVLMADRLMHGGKDNG